MIRHSVPLETKFAADESGIIAGYASVFGGEPDAFGDIVRPGAFTASLAKHQRQGTMPSLLWAHDQAQPIGTWTDVHEDATGLSVRGRLVLETRQGAEAYALLKAHALSGLSIGFIETAGTNLPTGGRRLDAIDLKEISLVTLPAADGARIHSVKSVSDVNPKLLNEILRNAGLSKGMAQGIIERGWRGAINELDAVERKQIEIILQTLKSATTNLTKGKFQ